ncbi:MAG: hypothetical protein ACLFUU_03680 [Desulfobacteraceae bacterium]
METDEYLEYQKLLAELYHRAVRSPNLPEEHSISEELEAELPELANQPED